MVRRSLNAMSVAHGGVEVQMARAAGLLSDLTNQRLDTVTVRSLDQKDAPFLALVVSKLSPILGNLLERHIASMLSNDLMTNDTASRYRWVRQDPEFPDALLVATDGTSTRAGYEVKAWYPLSTEVTGRFRESLNLLAGRDVRLTIVSWMMDRIVYGTPVILDVLLIDARSVAEARDAHYHNYLIVEPRDTSARTRNLQQTNVNGYKLQEASAARRAEAEAAVATSRARTAPPHSQEAQALASDLMARFAYRLDTNFAKLDRIDHPTIESFKRAVHNTNIYGRTVLDWSKVLRAAEDDSKPQAKAAAERAIAELYAASTI